jgi:hypothetical protein
MAKSKLIASSKKPARSARKHTAAIKKAVQSNTARQRRTAQAETQLNPGGTKQAHVIALLERDSGATLDELVAATGWLPHTGRAALTGLRHKGFVLDKSKRQDGITVYRISSARHASEQGKSG